MIKYILYTLLGIPVFIMLLSFATILKQGVSLVDSPGIKIRLFNFLRNNTVETTIDHLYPELRTKNYSTSSKQLKEVLIGNIRQLGWEIESNNANNLHIIITSSMFKFKDDMFIELIPQGSNKTLVNIKSSSRVGRADFAANLGHVVKLNKHLQNSFISTQ